MADDAGESLCPANVSRPLVIFRGLSLVLLLLSLLGPVVANGFLPRIADPGPGSQPRSSNGPTMIALHRQSMPIADSEQVVHAYFGSVYIGGLDGQEFSVVFDTGSGHVIVPSKTCGSQSCLKHRRYNRQASNSAVIVGADGRVLHDDELVEEITVEFGTGTISGQFARDVVCVGLGGPSEAHSTVEASIALQLCTQMNIVEANIMSDHPFDAFAFDGMLGLGLGSLALSPNFSFFNQLTARRDGDPSLPHPHFAIFLSAGVEDENDQHTATSCGFSELAIGGHNPERLRGPISWVPVASPEEGYWQVPIVGVRVGNWTLEICKGSKGCHGIVDTGSSMLGAPESATDELARALSVATELADSDSHHNRDTNCHRLLGLGRRLHFDLVGGVTLTLDPEDYASRMPRRLRQPSEIHRASPNEGAPNWWCGPELVPIGHVEESSAEDGDDQGTASMELPEIFIFGEPVLQRYYTVFDWAELRIGFGEAAQCTTSRELLARVEMPVEEASSSTRLNFRNSVPSPSKDGAAMPQLGKNRSELDSSGGHMDVTGRIMTAIREAVAFLF